MIKDALKKYVPESVWKMVRVIYYRILNKIRDIGPYVRHRSYCGYKLFYNRGNNIINRLENEPIFEERMCSLIEAELKKQNDAKFLDIGANIGLISLYVKSRIPTVKIFAFEPGPVQRSFLEMAVSNNNLAKDIKVFGQALSKEAGVMQFYSHDPKYIAGDGFIDTGRASGAKSISVQVDTVDSWWQKSGQPKINVVKIDTEGAELWVLQGARNFLKTIKPVIFLEIEPRNLRVYPYNHLDILKFFEEASYELFDLQMNKITSSNIEQALHDGKDTYCARSKA